MALKVRIILALCYSGLVLAQGNYACGMQDPASQDLGPLASVRMALPAVEIRPSPNTEPTNPVSKKIKQGVSKLERGVAYLGGIFSVPPPLPPSFRLVEQESSDGSVAVFLEGTEPNNLFRELNEKIATVTWFFDASKEIAEKRSEKLLLKIARAETKLKDFQGRPYTEWPQKDMEDFLACTAYLREPSLSATQISRESNQIKLLIPPKLKENFHNALNDRRLAEEIWEYDSLKKKISHLEKEQEALESSYKVLSDCLEAYKNLPTFIQVICHFANLYPNYLLFDADLYSRHYIRCTGILVFNGLAIKPPFFSSYSKVGDSEDVALRFKMGEKSYQEIKEIARKVYNLLNNQFVMGEKNPEFFDAVTYPIRSHLNLLDSLDSYIERRENENIELKDTFIKILQTFHQERLEYGKPLVPVKATDIEMNSLAD